MKLSIIVPVYNVKNFLHECLDSLVNQTVDDYEIILIDDGSTDGSADIIREYEARYPELIRSKFIDNGGQGRARNFGIEMARGEYLGFVDSDDWVEPGMYDKLCTIAYYTGADVVFCDFMEHFSDGRINYLSAAIQDEKLAAAGSSCNKIFRASIINETRFPQGLWYEDFYFSAVLLLKSRKTEYLTEPMYIYRRGQESTMHNNNASKNLDMIKIMDMLADYMMPRDLGEDFEFLMINHVGIDSINRLASQQIPDNETIRELRAYLKKRVPRLASCSAFRKETLNRRIICWLNYHGLHKISRSILEFKHSVERLTSPF